jgi:uncharacterized protein (TIGR04141 family)
MVKCVILTPKMKVNVFKIPKDRISDLKSKLKSPGLGLKVIHSEKIGEYQADFYFSQDAPVIPIPWVDTFAEFFPQPRPTNQVYYGCYIWENQEYCFVLSYGKCHFYLRQFCDNEFGTFMAKRIANEADTRQKSSRKFAGKKKKEIKSYTKNSRLDTESGESIEYLNAGIIESQTPMFGKTAKFGSSLLLSIDKTKDQLHDFLKDLVVSMNLPENFSLPRTTIINGTAQSQKYEDQLVRAIIGDSSDTDFASNSHELFGVDFVFSGQEKYKFKHRGVESTLLDDLSIAELRKFIIANSIPAEEVMAIWVIVEREDGKGYRKQVKDSLDYIVDEHNVILSQGNWMEFNEDYLKQLNEYVNDIEIEETEADLLNVQMMEEDDFNKKAVSYGYKNTDKDFSKLKIKSAASVEAWDLEKDETVYAVKIGTPQKLGYVCDQAINTLEIINKKANLKKLNKQAKNYTLWLVFKRGELKTISEIKSIIFKQKIESWARKCHDFGVIPRIKISYITKKELDK